MGRDCQATDGTNTILQDTFKKKSILPKHFLMYNLAITQAEVSLPTCNSRKEEKARNVELQVLMPADLSPVENLAAQLMILL